MAELLKNLFTNELIQRIGEELNNADPSVDSQQFVNHVLDSSWNVRELKDRTKYIAEQFHAFLPYEYKKQIEILSKVAPKFQGFTATIFPTFVELYGLDDPKISIKALELYTQYSTSEFAIRHFLVQDPTLIQTFYKWSKNKNFHVRRLASEGCRPLLPWAIKLHDYVKDPSPILPILEQLKNDEEDYVYRSVANNLNDISKNHPELVLDLCEQWIGETKTTKWVVKHGLRTLLKKGNQRAMKLFGFGSITSISVESFQIKDQKIAIGDSSELSIKLKNTGKTSMYRFEYSVGYLKKNGSHSEKVFHLKESELKKGESLEFTKKINFANLTTRKHYPGKHFVILKINGNKTSTLEFELV